MLTMTVRSATRRSLLRHWRALPALALAPAPWRGLLAAGTELPLTPSCTAPGEVTEAQTEGPFFTPDTPLRGHFREAGLEGEPMSLLGFVVDRHCRPSPGALIELWHCDAQGVYDIQGYRMRGHQFADNRGRFVFETIVPGLYPGRTRHFHIKVQARGQRVLTTQLYFPDEPLNARDGIFSADLIMDVAATRDGRLGRFDFVV